jgi:hypothetical protein
MWPGNLALASLLFLLASIPLFIRFVNNMRKKSAKTDQAKNPRDIGTSPAAKRA